MTNYAEEQYINNGYTPTPEPQSLAVKSAHAQAKLTEWGTASAEAQSPITITKIDGVDTVIARPALSGEAGVAQMVSDEDLRLMGEEPLKFPQCAAPGCKGEGRNQIISGAGKPVSVNHKGQLVFHDPEPVHHYGMSANDQALAQARGLANVTGGEVIDLRFHFSGQVARQAPKLHVDVCDLHRDLPRAPQKPKQEREAGPFASHVQASTEAHKVELRTRKTPRLTVVKTSGSDQWFVRWTE